MTALDWEGAAGREKRRDRRPGWWTLPPTRAQLLLLAQHSNMKEPAPRTRGEASERISRLRVRPSKP